MGHEPQFILPDCDQQLPDILLQLETETGHTFRCVRQTDDTPAPEADYVVFSGGDYYALFQETK